MPPALLTSARLPLPLLALLLLGSALGDGTFEFEKGVLVLTEANFDSAVAQFNTLLVEFHAPWCGACKAMEPEYAKAAELLAKRRSPAKLAKVDVTVEKRLGDRFDIRGYPTLKLFKDGLPTDCRGAETADDVVAWLEKKLAPPCQKLESIADARRLAASGDVALIGFFRNAASSLQFTRTVFYDAGSIACGLAASQETFADFGVDGDTVALFNNLDARVLHYTGPFGFEQLRAFLRNNRLPLVAELNDESSDAIFSHDGATALLYVRRGDGEAEFRRAIDQLRPAAQRFKDKVRFAFVDVNKEDVSGLRHRLRVTDDELPALAMLSAGATFRLQYQDLGADSVQAFVGDVLEGRARPFLRSQPLPADWNSRPVKLLVGANFNEVARNMSANVLVKLCVPQMPRCKEVQEAWQSLAEAYQHDDSVVIAEIDVMENDIENLKLRGLPSAKFYPALANSIVDYGGEHSLRPLRAFVETNKRLRKDRKAARREEL